MKNAWFPFTFNNVELRLFVPSSGAEGERAVAQQNVTIRPKNALTIIETTRLIHYLKIEGFLD